MADEPTDEELAEAMADLNAAPNEPLRIPSDPPPFERPAPPDGLPGYYTCEHGVSNVPCICHMVVAMHVGDPRPVTQPDDWHHFAGGEGGITDKSNVG